MASGHCEKDRKYDEHGRLAASLSLADDRMSISVFRLSGVNAACLYS